MFKNKLIPIAALTAVLATPAFAGNNTTPMAMSDVIKAVNAAGYTTISQITFSDNVYDVRAINNIGEKVDLKVGPTGAVTPPDQAQPQLSILDAAKTVEAANYNSISRIEYDNGEYEVTALDPTGDSVDLIVNAQNGALQKD